ncbi:hypothetical protein MW695_20330, partial [Alkalihalobacillus sp. APA_J-10(15)]|nr:hypothetical protein [Halalkalibacter sp. APA_J-10(15)]
EHWLNSIGVAGIVAGGSLAGTTLRSTTNQLNTGPRVNSGGQGSNNDGVRVNGDKGKDISHPVLDNTRTGSALKEPDGQHGFNDIIDNYTPYAKEFKITGGDGVQRNLSQIEGGIKYYDYKDVYNKDLRITERITTVKDQNGIFEWIVDPNNGVTHRRFIPNGQITGFPNQITKK